ncbi:mandelate racemase/muconate lactonizing enzyme family protein [Bordetella sp. BOR01]|uniref:mandelate racemase/muconate lactonizing enzyme family protein n=1 Tax=Bordetella sp. BOR01 TaxID=2854779 RepID=UPI001C470AF6|nr:mandelate racemase/muconate lactonizing enzyme family protein [Bordetella sp. BOR01]MBV7483389.1 mandelate racemase/muconate lactonizing enzyme family protein [Bordetella sp. BOR01]
MRITRVRELSVLLEGNIANSLVNFSEHTISLVAVATDAMRNGKPVVGYAFDSIGRYAQPGLLRERFIPRLLAAKPADLLDEGGTRFDPARISKLLMRNEKPGGHGDRAAAVGALELAFWDLNAKLADEPACRTLAHAIGRELPPTPADIRVPVYAAGGYYYGDDGIDRLQAEFRGYQDAGFTKFKMKIGGTSLPDDLKRIEAAIAVVGSGTALAVDANGRFDLQTALDYAKAIEAYDLRWYEEIGDPLDYDLNRRVAEAYTGRIATGENLFSAQDVKNLALFAGMRPSLDIFQMDPGLAYGVTEFLGMIGTLESHGFGRSHMHPHGGHLINLHIAAGLGLGGCEAYPGVFQPFGGYPDTCRLGEGYVSPTDAPGFGLEQKVELAPYLKQLDTNN